MATTSPKNPAAAVSEAIDWAGFEARHPALADLPVALRLAVRSASFAQGERIFRSGERPDAVLYLLAGEVHLLRRSREGAEIILQRSRGGFFAEASLESARYHCDAVAAEAGALLRFPAIAFRDALARHAAFRNGWITHLLREVRRLRGQCERLNLKSAAERIIHYIESEGSDGTLLLAQTKKAWAAELGLSHEALYRTLRRLQQAGDIVVDGARISRR